MRGEDEVLSAYSTQFGRTLKEWLQRPKKATSVSDIGEVPAVIGSTIGEVRTENQDRAVIARFTGYPFGFTLLAACDGMGGMKSGSECAEIAIVALLESCIDLRTIDPREKLRAGISKANEAVFKALRGDGGTTIAAVIGSMDRVSIATVGDTRVYSYEKEPPRLTQLSFDDTLVAELKRLRGPDLKTAVLDEYAGRLAQFVGMGGDMDPRLYTIDEVKVIGLLIATDGAYAMPSPTFDLVAQSSGEPSQSISRLLQVARWCGGRDNATIGYAPTRAFIGSRPGQVGQPSRLEIWDSYGKLEVVVPCVAEKSRVLAPEPIYGTRAPAPQRGAKAHTDRKARKDTQHVGPKRKNNQDNSPTTDTTGRSSAPVQRELRMEISTDEAGQTPVAARVASRPTGLSIHNKDNREMEAMPANPASESSNIPEPEQSLSGQRLEGISEKAGFAASQVGGPGAPSVLPQPDITETSKSGLSSGPRNARGVPPTVLRGSDSTTKDSDQPSSGVTTSGLNDANANETPQERPKDGDEGK
jgi:serine/threonine protein phosphatase PrpC